MLPSQPQKTLLKVELLQFSYKNVSNVPKFSHEKRPKASQNKHFPSIPGDFVTHMGDREIWSVPVDSWIIQEQNNRHCSNHKMQADRGKEAFGEFKVGLTERCFPWQDNINYNRI